MKCRILITTNPEEQDLEIFNSWGVGFVDVDRISVAYKSTASVGGEEVMVWNALVDSEGFVIEDTPGFREALEKRFEKQREAKWTNN
jgi:hypothetical protein